MELSLPSAAYMQRNACVEQGDTDDISKYIAKGCYEFTVELWKYAYIECQYT